jgi:microcystin-dependent protein
VPATTISSAAVNDDFADIALALTGSVAADGQTTMTGALKAAAGAQATPSYTFGGATGTGFWLGGNGSIGISVHGGTFVLGINTDGLVNTNNIPIGVPVGALMDYAGSTAPAGWLLCYGQSLSTTTYALLFAVIGYTYGGAGANFSLPDYRGRTGFGVDNMGGVAANRITTAVSGIDGVTLSATGGAQSRTVTEAQLPVVSHTLTGSATATPTISGTVTPTISGTVTPTLSGSHTFSLNQSNIAAGTATFGAGAFPGAPQGATTPTVTIDPSFFTVSTINGSSFTNSAINGASFTNSTISINGSSFTYSFGSGTALPIMPPTIMINKIIFAGA